jgi:methylenetetrahydrofolate dehydrogenase (NAD+)
MRVLAFQIFVFVALAIVKSLKHLGLYDSNFQEGSQLSGKTITVVNRSDIVGRPLVALLANDGIPVAQRVSNRTV